MFTLPDQSLESLNSNSQIVLNDPYNPIRQIINMVPEGSTVLDIGTGAGVLARVIQLMGKKITLDGIEANEVSFHLAKNYYRSMLKGSAADYFEVISKEKYDYIILADVLEHMYDPASFLLELKKVSGEAKLLVSIPNIAFGGVRLSLLNGEFTYVNSGLLEKTHLRFFTLSSIQKMFLSVDLFPSKIISLERSFYRTEFSRASLVASPFVIAKLAFCEEARAYQYLFELTKTNSSKILFERNGSSGLRILKDAFLTSRFFQ